MSKVIKGVLAVVFIGAFAAAAFFILGQKQQQQEAYQQQTQEIMANGVDTVGTPVDVAWRSESRRGSRASRDYYAVVYSYTVDGKQYTVKGREFNSKFDADDERNSGEKKVRYLPESPEQSRVIAFTQ